MNGTLFVIATPIGNLEDLSFRALRILKEVDLIACEDTRHTQILLNKYGIKKSLISYFQHSKLEKVDYLIFQLKSGKNIALVCDAGTPDIDDPGGVLIQKASQEKIQILPVPGPSALDTALSISGFLANSFLFLGFLPKKKGRKKLIELAGEFSKNTKSPIALFESPHRIKATLMELQQIWGDKELVVARELTKKFETIYRGKISEVLPQIKEKGEFVVIIKGKK